MSLCRIVEMPKGATREQIAEYVEATHAAQMRGRIGVDPKLVAAVAKILEDVRKQGWKAAIKYTRRFDCPTLKAGQMEVSRQEISQARVPDYQHDAIVKSIERVRAFHEKQLSMITKGWKRITLDLLATTTAWEWRMPAREMEPTGFEGQRLLPLASVGVYVPGGKANYPSSVIMNCVPSLVAGVGKTIISTPPREDGSISPAVLVAARELGIETIVKCGGTQAVGLMAFGPHSGLEEMGAAHFDWGGVDKIAGPGNKWVNEAKRQLWGQVGLDTFAGPSEVCVMADETANPAFAAADWLTQVEHAEDNVGYLVTTTREVADRIVEEAEKQLKNSPREVVMREALRNHGLIVVGPSADYCGPITASSLAPEHVNLMVRDTEAALNRVSNGGCVLLGDYTPQSAGDFVSGPSHTLPTGGAARFGSPVNVLDFLKFQSISCLKKEDLHELLPAIEAFGEMEGFPQHARGARIRFED